MIDPLRLTLGLEPWPNRLSLEDFAKLLATDTSDFDHQSFERALNRLNRIFTAAPELFTVEMTVEKVPTGSWWHSEPYDARYHGPNVEVDKSRPGNVRVPRSHGTRPRDAELICEQRTSVHRYVTPAQAARLQGSMGTPCSDVLSEWMGVPDDDGNWLSSPDMRDVVESEFPEKFASNPDYFRRLICGTNRNADYLAHCQRAGSSGVEWRKDKTLEAIRKNLTGGKKQPATRKSRVKAESPKLRDVLNDRASFG